MWVELLGMVNWYCLNYLEVRFCVLGLFEKVCVCLFDFDGVFIDIVSLYIKVWKVMFDVYLVE